MDEDCHPPPYPGLRTRYWMFKGSVCKAESISAKASSTISNALDSKMLSVVSYAEHEDYMQRIDFAPYDLLALKYLYGLKPQNLGDNT